MPANDPERPAIVYGMEGAIAVATHPAARLVVSALGQPQWLMEIDVVAVIPE